MKHSILIFATLGVGLATAPVLAAPDNASPPAPALSSLPLSSPDSPFDTAVSDASLDEYRGGHTETNINNLTNTNNLDGKLYNNQAFDNVTGSNFVTDGAFSGNSGLSTVVQNSGNNVLIQNATILNLRVQ